MSSSSSAQRRLLPKCVPKVRARFIAIETTCRMREAIEAGLRRGNGMILPLGEALGEGRSLDDVLSNRAILLWGQGRAMC